MLFMFWSQENISQHKLISSVGSAAISNCMENDTAIISGISSDKKEPTLKCLASKKKKKALKASKVSGKNKKLVFPLHGILKNRTKVFQVKKPGSSISQDAGKISTCKTQRANKHVTFSVHDDVLVARRNANSTVELGLGKFCSLSSDVTGASMVNNHTAETGGGQTIHQLVEVEEENDNCQENETNVQLDSGMQFSISCHDTDAPNFLTYHVSGQGNLCNKSVALSPFSLRDENLKSLEGYSRGKSHDALYRGSTLPVIPDDRIAKLTNPVIGQSTGASSSSGSFSGYFTDFRNAYPQPSTSCKSIVNENENEPYRLHFPSQVTRQYYYDHSLQCPWFPHLSPKELMRTICPFQDWKSRVGISGETGINEDLVGLPLNSQGELIRMNSNVTGRFDHLRDTTTIMGPSICSPMPNDVQTNFMFDQAYFRSWNGVTSQADHFRMCRREDFGREMENLSMSSRFNPMEQSYGVRRTNVTGMGLDPSFCALESEVLSNSSRQDQLVKNHSGNPSHISLQFSQSTMRLMGKEFKIGGNELQELEEREIWRDKEALKVQHASATTECPCIRCHDLPEFSVHPMSTKLKNAAIHLSEAEVNPASESRIFSQIMQSQDNMAHQDGYGIGKGSTIPEICSQFSLAPSPLTGSGRTVFQDPFVCGYRSPTASQTLVPASLFHDSNQYLNRSCIELTNIENPPNLSNLAFNLPSLDKECGGHVQQPWSQNSFKVTTPRWLDSRKKGTLSDYNQAYPFPVSSCHDWSISGIDQQIEPSVYPTSEPFCMFPDAVLQNSLVSSSLLPRQLLQVHSGISPDSVSQNGYREKMKFENCVNSRLGIRIPNPVRRSKKRMASPSDEAVKLSKMAKLRIQENSMNTITAVQTIPVFEPNVRYIREVPESASGKHEANAVECSKNAAHKAENIVGFGMPFNNKLQGVPRSGPVRLTPGAKYVLKSSQNKEQTNFKASHSGNPSAEMATEDRDNVSAKIHRF